MDGAGDFPGRPSDGPTDQPVHVPADTAAAPADFAAYANGDRLLPAVCELCAEYGAAETIGNVRAAMLNELSGLAASRVHPDVFYGTNDDDDDLAQFFAMDAEGRGLGLFIAEGRQRKVDTEDIAVGPCSIGSCVYLADAGDGGRVQTTPIRTEYALFIMPEPLSPMAVPYVLLPFERIRFAYPDGSHDSEAIVVDPMSGTVYLLTKVRTGLTSAYRLPNPLRADALNVATKVADIPILAIVPSDNLQVTAATAHPCGAAILVTTYSHIFELRRPAGADFAAVFSATPTRWSAPPAVESITYRADGRGYLAAPEGVNASIAGALCR